MNVFLTVLIAFIVGAVVGTIAGAMLGGGRALEIYDELEIVRRENESLKEKVKADGPQVIEIKDNRPQAADITKNYFTEF